MAETCNSKRPLVFLSYSHSDSNEASCLRNDMVAAGVESVVGSRYPCWTGLDVCHPRNDEALSCSYLMSFQKVS